MKMMTAEINFLRVVGK